MYSHINYLHDVFSSHTQQNYFSYTFLFLFSVLGPLILFLVKEERGSSDNKVENIIGHK